MLSFWCAAVAAITLKGLNPFGNGSLVLVSLTKRCVSSADDKVCCYLHQTVSLLGIRHLYHPRHFRCECHVLHMLVVADAQGVYGAVFARLNILWSRHVRQGTWLGKHPILEVLLVRQPMSLRLSPHATGDRSYDRGIFHEPVLPNGRDGTRRTCK